MDGHKLTATRSLSRHLALSFSAFVLLGSLAVAGWMAWWHRQQALDDLEQLAKTNVAFVTELRLPKSRELAMRLAHILDCGVGFHFGGSSGSSGGGQRGAGDWPPELAGVIERLAARREPAAAREGGYAVAVAPFAAPDAGVSLILVRQSGGLLPGIAGGAAAPALAITLTGAILAILIGRRIIRPLEAVAGWLPNLDSEDGSAKPLPARISSRPDEIGALARALEQTGEHLRRERERRQRSERLATLGRIATSLAHEIKNPAAAIALHADILAARVSPEDAESIELIHEEVDRITDLVNQWLFVARAARLPRRGTISGS
ncbi:MAG: histidine kinase dimerization/phospho-acceptor domain-containing protein [Verrucomicrobiales bacterium]